jgi:hypothetical protein
MICRNGHPAEPSDRCCPTCAAQIESEEAAMESESSTTFMPPPIAETVTPADSATRETDEIGVEPLLALKKDQSTEGFWEGEGFRASESFWEGESFWERLRDKKNRLQSLWR